MEYKLDGTVLRCRNVAELSKFYDNVMRLKRFLPPPTEPVGRVARYEVTGGTVFELLGNGPELDAPDDRTQVPITPMFRVDGALVPLKNGERLVPEDLQKMAFEIMNPLQQARFEETRETAFEQVEQGAMRRNDIRLALEVPLGARPAFVDLTEHCVGRAHTPQPPA